jgi:hypothetical protein
MQTLTIRVDGNNIDQTILKLQKISQELKTTYYTVEEYALQNNIPSGILRSLKLISANLYREKFHKDPKISDTSQKRCLLYSHAETEILDEAYKILQNRII